MRPPDFDRRPIYTDGVRVGWVGYGTFDEWPSACLWIVVWKEDALTKAEQACCHMSMWSLSAGDLSQWRRDFAKLPRSELCHDCPVIWGPIAQRVARLRQMI